MQISDIQKDPMRLIELYLRFNQKVFTLFYNLFKYGLWIIVIALLIKNGLDEFGGMFRTSKSLFVKFISTILGSIKDLILPVIICLFMKYSIDVYIKLITTLESMLPEIKLNGFKNYFSVRENISKLNNFFVKIFILNCLSIVVFPLMQTEDKPTLVEYFVDVILGVFTFPLIQFGGVMPLVFIAINELLHKVSLENKELKEEVEHLV